MVGAGWLLGEEMRGCEHCLEAGGKHTDCASPSSAEQGADTDDALGASVTATIAAQGASWWLRRESVCLQCRRPGLDPWVGKIPWRRKWQPTPVFFPGESQGRRNLAGYSPWGRKESDTTERLHFSALPWLVSAHLLSGSLFCPTQLRFIL